MSEELKITQETAKKIFIWLFVFFIVYCIGFCWFSAVLPTKPTNLEKRTDAIIVLTGEGSRITEGVKELARGASDRLYISGIYKERPVGKVVENTVSRLRESKNVKKYKFLELVAARYETGQATNTIGNAFETARWAQRNEVKSIRLVTSFYHYPRAELLFKRNLRSVVIVPHPIPVAGEPTSIFKSRRVFFLVLSEYNKYIITVVAEKLGFSDATLEKFSRGN